MNRTPIRYLMTIAIVIGVSACSGKQTGVQPVPTDYLAVALGQVDVQGGLLGIATGATGQISQVEVHEGQSVQRGQLLLTIDDKAPKSAVATAVASQAQANAEVHALEGQWHTAVLRAQRLATAAKEGAGDRQSAEDGAATATTLEAQLEGAKAALRVASARTAEARRQLQLTKLRAPAAGQVIAIAGRQGTSVTPEMTVITLLPASPLIVRAELETQQVSAVSKGMNATITDEDTGATLASAKVDRLGVIAGPSTLVSDPQRRAAIRTVECVLTLPADNGLRVGQRVVVRFPRQATAARN